MSVGIEPNSPIAVDALLQGAIWLPTSGVKGLLNAAIVITQHHLYSRSGGPCIHPHLLHMLCEMKGNLWPPAPILSLPCPGGSFSLYLLEDAGHRGVGWVGPGGLKHDRLSFHTHPVPLDPSEAAYTIFDGMSAHARVQLMQRMSTPPPTPTHHWWSRVFRYTQTTQPAKGA